LIDRLPKVAEDIPKYNNVEQSIEEDENLTRRKRQTSSNQAFLSSQDWDELRNVAKKLESSLSRSLYSYTHRSPAVHVNTGLPEEKSLNPLTWLTQRHHHLHPSLPGEFHTVSKLKDYLRTHHQLIDDIDFDIFKQIYTHI